MPASQSVCITTFYRTVKHSWLELGNQLSSLATLHADKAKAYMTEVRQPLLDLAPKLEEARKEVGGLHLSCGRAGNADTHKGCCKV